MGYEFILSSQVVQSVKNMPTMQEKVKVAQLSPTLCDPIQSMEFSRPEYWSELPFHSPGDLPDPGIEPMPPALWASLVAQLVKNPPAMRETWV